MRSHLRRGGLGALLAAAGLALPACGQAPAPPVAPAVGSSPNVLLITLDTTRADHLGLYGYPRATSPVLDRLAADSLVFDDAISTTSWTLPAHASLFTGKLPTAHGAHTDPEGPYLLEDGLEEKQGVPDFRVSTLRPDEATLAERLRRAGYATAGVAGGPWLKRLFGLAEGFERWDDAGITTWRGAPGAYVTQAALAQLEQIAPGPFFLFANYFDPHYPYRPALLDRLRTFGNPLERLRDGLGPALLVGAYDAEIRGMDREVGRLLDALRERGLYDDMLIVVTADHGELLGEAGHFGHGSYLTEPELRVPLLLKLPRGARAGERVEQRVSIAGVQALILEQAGLAVPAHTYASVTALLPDPVLAETYPLEAQSHDGHWRALYVGSLKYLWNSKGNNALRDLSHGWDPGQNLLDRSPEVGRRMEALLLASLPEPPAREAEPTRAVDAETREALRNLGYLR